MREESGKKRSFFERLMRFLNMLAILVLIGSYAGGMISPETFWPLAFFAMAYPIVLVCILAFSVYWLLKRGWFLFLNVALLLIKPDHVLGTVGVFGNSEIDTSGISVMSYNVRLFDKFNWSSNTNSKDKIIKFITEQNPDIVCIQEFYDVDGKVLSHIAANRAINIHLRNYYAQRNNKNDFGIATISRYPMIHKGKIVLENSRSALAIFTDLKIGDDTIRVYNFHLQSIHLGNEGYEVLDDLIHDQEMDELSDSKLLAGRLKSGFVKRSIQAEEIARHIAESPYRVMVCGDFNDVPTSYTYQTIAKRLEDSFTESGKGFGATYVRVPFFRIDNILHSTEFTSSNHQVFDKKALSDHYAVSARLSLTE